MRHILIFAVLWASHSSLAESIEMLAFAFSERCFNQASQAVVRSEDNPFIGLYERLVKIIKLEKQTGWRPAAGDQCLLRFILLEWPSNCKQIS